jgi:hypothetical protein
MKHFTILATAVLALALPTMAAAASAAALTTTPAASGVKLQMREGRPVVDGVMVNGHGPYRFLLDTGATLNTIDPTLAQSIGLTVAFLTQLTSSTGVTSASGSEGGEIRLGPVTAGDQVFLFTGMDAVHKLSSDIQGVLGQVFLSQFDYLLDVRGGRMEFGKRELHGKGARAPFRIVQGRPVVDTSLGPLVLDSGAHLMVRFGVEATQATAEMVTMSGTMQVGMVFSKLAIDGRTLWRGDAVAVPHTAEAGAAGLLPVSLFKTVYVCNSGRYVVLD